MKHLLACAAVASTFLFAGCAATPNDSKHADIPYTDQRSVKTRPTPPDGKKADVLVRVSEVQAAAGMVSVGDAPPADAKLLVSVETLATFGTPFYCTVGLAEHRYELGGLVTRLPNGTCRIQTDYADRRRAGQTGVNTLNELPIGQTRVLMGTSDGRLITMVLEPLASK